jgi:large subunit ribosomal protein L4
MKFDVYNKKGEVVGAVEAPDSIFGVKADAALVHEATVAQQANSRVVLAHVKDRGEVRGGGKKPWKQKGTGRARHGSTRSPLWVGGGVTFGPSKFRNFALKINKRARRKALFMALSDKATNGAIIIVEDLIIEAPKTKFVATLLNALPCVGKKQLIVVDAKNKDFKRAAANIENAITIAPNSVNTLDVMKSGVVVMGKNELELLSKHFVKA